jgi:phosphoribosylformimino-5-aminoimidazole carboxamide ribotide isomerase
VRVIPAIDIINGEVVRLLRGNPNDKIVYSRNPIEVAKKWETAGADMLHIVDLDAALCNGKNNTETISKIIDAVNIPVEVAGGIRSVNTIDKILKMNAARVVLGTIAYTEPELLRQIAKKRAGKIVISVDQNNGKVMIDGWRKSTGSGVNEAISLFLPVGIKEFLLTSIHKDGTLSGPDIVTLSCANTLSGAKIIASGGVSSIEDVIRVRSIGCSSVILGKALYEGKVNIEKVKMIT